MRTKIIQVNQGAKLTREEFVEVLRTWKEFHDMGSGNAEGLRKVAAALYVPDGLHGSPAVYRVKKAKNIALRNGDIEEIAMNIAEAVHILTE